MFYPVCPSCGFLLADKEIELCKKLDPLIFSEINKKDKSKDDKNIINDLLNEFKIKNYCCRSVVLTSVKLIELYR